MIASLTRFSRVLAAGTTAAITMLSLSACNNVTPVMPNTPITQPEQAAAPMVQVVVGDYADAGYENRSQGYDWVGVMVRSAGNEQIDIKVRARSDIKNQRVSLTAPPANGANDTRCDFPNQGQ